MKYTNITNEILTARRAKRRLVMMAKVTNWLAIISLSLLAGFLLGHVLAFYFVNGGHAIIK